MQREEKTFLDIKVGDCVVCYDQYSHDYIEHILKIDSIEYDREYITDTNPKGKVCYGTDQTFPEDECEDYLTVVDEENFVRFA